MTNYVLLFSGGKMPETEEQQQAVMAAWGAWYGNLGEAIVDGGNPFSPASATIASDGTVSEGTGAGVSGYTIISADSLQSASAHAKGCPILSDGGTVYVHEAFAM